MNRITGLPENCCEEDADIEDALETIYNAFIGTSHTVNNNNNLKNLMTLPENVGTFLIRKSPPVGLHLRYKAILDYMTHSNLSFTVKFDIHIPETITTWPLAVIVLNPKNTGGARIPINVDFNLITVSNDSVKYSYNIESDGVFYKVLTNTYTNVGLFGQYNFRPEINVQLSTTASQTDYNILWNVLTIG